MYYIIQHTRIQYAGTYNINSRLFWQDNPVRIDSSNYNIYSTTCMIDSLRAKVNDSSIICGGYHGPVAVCSDTSVFGLFNNSRKSKNYIAYGLEGTSNQRYVSGIGMANFNFTQQMSNGSQILKGCVINGIVYGDTSMLTGLTQISAEIPKHFSLSQNYPNPFNPTTKFKFSIPSVVILSGAKNPEVKLVIYDVLGSEIQTLVNRSLSSGTYEVDWEASEYPSGVYYYQLSVNNEQSTNLFTQTKKMILVK